MAMGAGLESGRQFDGVTRSLPWDVWNFPVNCLRPQQIVACGRDTLCLKNGQFGRSASLYWLLTLKNDVVHRIIHRRWGLPNFVPPCLASWIFFIYLIIVVRIDSDTSKTFPLPKKIL